MACLTPHPKGVSADPADVGFLAVYGSLRRRHPAKLDFVVRKKICYVGQAWIRGMLVYQNGYPAALENQPGEIGAELCWISETDVWPALDRYEGFNSKNPRYSLFYRKLVYLKKPPIWAWVYFLGGEIPRGDLIRLTGNAPISKQKIFRPEGARLSVVS